jgi:hypothetical protein
VKLLARDVRDLDRRLVRVETTLELATRGRFAVGPALAPPDPDAQA